LNNLDPAHWVPLDTLSRLLLALGVGLFVGLEREWRGKEAGLRTFGLVALLGGLGGMLGTSYALLAVSLTGLLVVFLNVQSVVTGQGTELTTSAAILVTALAGVLCGLGHKVTPVAVAVVTAGLLSWKERLAEFGHKLTQAELRSAILLGILAFAIYPVLPDHPIDRWGLIEPREAWLTVLLIAGMGFANYIMWKVFGTRGIEFAGFFGGLVNSTVTVTELATRVAETSGALAGVAYRGVLLSVVAMALRNAVILGLFKPETLFVAGTALGLMMAVAAGLAFVSRRPEPLASEGKPLDLQSPFSLASALKFGVVFLLLQVFATEAQTFFGRFGFYAVSFVGGFVSSASAVAAAAALASHGKIPPNVAGIGAVLASLASVGVNVGLVARLAHSPSLTAQLGRATALVLVISLTGALLAARFLH
jgi:uncharacterized membrane protein (DUF4010 family)